MTNATDTSPLRLALPADPREALNTLLRLAADIAREMPAPAPQPADLPDLTDPRCEGIREMLGAGATKDEIRARYRCSNTLIAAARRLGWAHGDPRCKPRKPGPRRGAKWQAEHSA